MELNICHACTHHNSLMHQQVTAEDASEMAWVWNAERRSLEQIIEEEQAHGVQVAALSQVQLQAMERVDAQEKELQRLSALLVEHKALLKYSPERPCQEHSQAPPQNLSQLRHEVIDYLTSMVNSNIGLALKTGQVPDLDGPPTIKRDTFEDILTDVEFPVTPQRQV